jgi:hypothetical protein
VVSGGPGVDTRLRTLHSGLLALSVILRALTKFAIKRRSPYQ